jgi:hypothetical protein
VCDSASKRGIRKPIGGSPKKIYSPPSSGIASIGLGAIDIGSSDSYLCFCDWTTDVTRAQLVVSKRLVNINPPQLSLEHVHALPRDGPGDPVFDPKSLRSNIDCEMKKATVDEITLFDRRREKKNSR